MPLELVSKLPYDHPYRWDGTLFGGPKLWRPNELGASLALWLDAEDTASITLNGATVSQWSDKSGNNRHATQTTAASQPQYQSNEIVGKNAVRFLNDFLNFDGSFLVNSNYHICAVAKRYSSALTFILGGSGQQLNANLHFGWRADTQFTIDQYGNGITGTVQAYSASTSVAIAGTDLSQSTGKYLRYNGSGIGNNLNLSPLVAYADSAIGLFIGATYDFSLGEIVIINNSLSTPDCQKLEGYLAWKWGLQANLPVSHPYTNTPPVV